MSAKIIIMENQPVRVRFAPSPTGPLHIGGVRTALFNYLIAKKSGGVFILRIEDTDQGRYVPGAEEYIIESLEWLGIRFDEGVQQGGPHAPYRQSERKELYRQYASHLVSNGFAYLAFDTPEELEAMRKGGANPGTDPLQYDASTRLSMRNSLTLSPEDVQALLDAGTPYVIRLKVPVGEDIHVSDLIRGDVTFHSAVVDDKVLFKSDGMPTYHLANVVDDHLMEISHVIRGEEWLPSTPIHVLLYRYLGWEATMPAFAHLPLLLKPDGKGKLSKRDGDRLGFPVFPLQWSDPFTGEISSGYRESGYFPEAVINFLAFLGWNPGTTKEIFSLDELVSAFSIDRVGKAGSKFDFEKGKWFNQHYLKEKSPDELAVLVAALPEMEGLKVEPAFLTRVCELMKDRAVFLRDIVRDGRFFFHRPDTYDSAVAAKRWKPELALQLERLCSRFDQLPDFSHPTLENLIKTFTEEEGTSPGPLMNAFRLAVVGTSAGPGMFDIIGLLGRDEVKARVNQAIAILGK